MDQTYDIPPGSVTIAPNVLTTIVRMTSLAQSGVLRLSRRTPSGLGRMIGRGAVAEGMRIEVFDDNSVTIDVHVIAEQGISLADLGEVLQTQLSRAMEHMVGMDVRAVNVFIDEIELESANTSG
ncbi:MAG: Asp23/Gls24 family envelope stress response protein [Chloroflexota bacterium]|nr:Asp23/Gls24 family envelope stress response protein [Chloroflexota bacterium]